MSNENKIILFGEQARDHLRNGMKKVYDPVRVTMGPAGRNVMIEDELMRPMASKDGVTVASYIKLSDRKEDMGAQLLKDVSKSTSTTSFDGTTTSTVLAYHLLENGLRAIKENKNTNLIDFKRGMDYATQRTIELLKEKSYPCESRDDIFKVAMISSNGDHEISELVTDAVTKTRLDGTDGSIDIEASTTYESHVEFSDAMIINSGYGKYYQFVNRPESFSHDAEDCRVFIFDGSMGTVSKPIQRLLSDCYQNDETLLIIAKEFSPAFVQNIVQNIRNGLKCLLVTAPEFGQYQQNLLHDIAVATMTEVFGTDGATEAQLNQVSRASLGVASRVTATTDKTYIKIGVNRSYIEKMLLGKTVEEIDEEFTNVTNHLSTSVEKHCTGLENSLKNLKSEAEKFQTKNRIKNLSSIKATILIHGATDVEMKEKKQRVEDAVFATSSAIEEGYVLGGGVTLSKISHILNEEVKDEDNDWNESFRKGFSNVAKSISEPMYQILRNAFKRPKGVEIGDIEVDSYEEVEIDTSFDSVRGFNVRTLEYVDNMIDAGIIDPTKVIRCALQNANSISSVTLTTECMIFSDSYYTEELSSRENHELMYGSKND